MLKYCLSLPIAVLALSCSSKDGDGKNPFDPGNFGNGGANGDGGSNGIPGAGAGNPVQFGGSTGIAGSGTGGGGELPPGSAEDLRKSSCAGWSAEPEGVPAILELIVDTSLSMAEMTRATNNRTKWEITRDALVQAVEALPPTTAIGVLYYPNRNTMGSNTARDVSACVNTGALIPVDLLGPADSNQRNAISSSLEQARPNGSTPTHDAYRYGLLNGLDQTQLQGNRFMLLITDGAPTLALQCIGQGNTQNPSPTQPIIDEVLAARTRGVRTFIIGSPGSEVSVDGGDARPWMSEAAVLGDTASVGCSIFGPAYCHVDLSQVSDFAVALRDALARIAGQVVSCSYDLPTPGPNETLDLTKVNVVYTPSGGQEQLIGRSDDQNCQDGWQLDASNRVVLCENTCRQVQADAGARLELLFGCTTNVNPPR